MEVQTQAASVSLSQLCSSLLTKPVMLFSLRQAKQNSVIRHLPGNLTELSVSGVCDFSDANRAGTELKWPRTARTMLRPRHSVAVLLDPLPPPAYGDDRYTTLPLMRFVTKHTQGTASLVFARVGSRLVSLYNSSHVHAGCVMR